MRGLCPPCPRRHILGEFRKHLVWTYKHTVLQQRRAFARPILEDDRWTSPRTMAKRVSGTATDRCYPFENTSQQAERIADRSTRRLTTQNSDAGMAAPSIKTKRALCKLQKSKRSCTKSLYQSVCGLDPIFPASLFSRLLPLSLLLLAQSPPPPPPAVPSRSQVPSPSSP